MDLMPYEPELDELLNDATVQVLMRRDGIERGDVERLAEVVRKGRPRVARPPRRALAAASR